MTCESFERWLDEDMPAATAAAARGHAADCEPCTASLRAALEIEALLATATRSAPAGFTDRAMARVAAADAAQRHAPIALPAPMAWWVRAASQPASALAATLAALMLWQRQALHAFALAATDRLASFQPSGPSLDLGPAFQRPDVVLGLALVVVPALVWAVAALFGWSDRLVVVRRPRRG